MNVYNIVPESYKGKGEHSVSQLEKFVEILLEKRHEYYSSDNYTNDVNHQELVDSSTEILKSLVSETKSVDSFQTHRLKLALEMNGVNTDELVL